MTKSSVKKNKSKKAPAADKAPSSKTPQVMRLVESGVDETSPMLLAGKSRIPRQIRGREPLSKLMKREFPESYFDAEDAEVVNVAALAVKMEAPALLDRFHACSCSKCVQEFTQRVLVKVEPRFSRVSKGGTLRSRELYERVEPMRQTVRPIMIRELIGMKKRYFHDDKA